MKNSNDVDIWGKLPSMDEFGEPPLVNEFYVGDRVTASPSIVADEFDVVSGDEPTFFSQRSMSHRITAQGKLFCENILVEVGFDRYLRDCINVDPLMLVREGSVRASAARHRDGNSTSMTEEQYLFRRSLQLDHVRLTGELVLDVVGLHGYHPRLSTSDIRSLQRTAFRATIPTVVGDVLGVWSIDEDGSLVATDHATLSMSYLVHLRCHRNVKPVFGRYSF